MDAKKIDAKEVVSASKKLSRKDAVALIKAAKKVIVAKGKKVQIFSRREGVQGNRGCALRTDGEPARPHAAGWENVAGRLR